jgi:hypothetical protein
MKPPKQTTEQELIKIQALIIPLLFTDFTLEIVELLCFTDLLDFSLDVFEWLCLADLILNQ